MSGEHVATMNALLEQSPEVREACATLPRPLSLAHRLTDGPDGAVVHWHTAASDTVRFSLGQADADVVYVGDWATAVRAMVAARDGVALDPGLRIEGDAAALPELARVLAVAARVATVPVDPPEALR